MQMTRMTPAQTKAAIVALVVLVLAGCRQSPEDRLYEAFKCASAAAVLEHEAEATRAGAKVETELAGYANSKERLRAAITELNVRFRKEFPESRQIQGLYDSKECQVMYAQALLNLGNTSATDPTGQASAGAAPAVPSGLEPAAPSSEQEAATKALMNVATLLATQRGGDPVAVAQFC